MALKLSSVAALAAILQLTQGHFTFMRIHHNGEWKEPLQYIRNKTSPFDEPENPYGNYLTRGYTDPTYGNGTDFADSVRCGRGNMDNAADTEVLTVRAGDTLEIAHHRMFPYEWTEDQLNNCPNGRGTCEPTMAGGAMDINHPGPVLVHLSKVPDDLDVHEYDGSGEWLKIWTLGLEWREDMGDPVHWLAYNNETVPARFIFKIPSQTPAGQYLMRMDLIWPGFDWLELPSSALAQLYPTCAQLQIESDVSGSLPEGGIMIPRDFSHSSPGMATSLEMYRNKVLDEDFVYPGGPLWDGEKLVVDKPVV